MQNDLQGFSGREIEGISCGFNVKIRLTPAERLEIHLENRQSYETYSFTAKPEDIKRQNIRNHCDLIQTGSELFQYFQSLLSKEIAFDELVKVEPKGKVVLRLEIQINLTKGSKRRMVIYEFQTIKQNLNSIQRLRSQVNDLNNGRLKFEKEIHKRIEQLQLENNNLRKQIEVFQKQLQGPAKNESNQMDLLKFATNRNSLIIKHGTYLQTANKLNILLILNNLASQTALEWKVRICNKMVLIFGIGSAELVELQGQALDQEINHQKLLTKEYFSGGEIITCTFQEGELKYTIERVDIEEDEGAAPEPNYNMTRGSFMCKKLAKLDLLYPCFGLFFGGRIEILSYGGKK